MSEPLKERQAPAEARDSASIIELASDWMSAASSRVKLTTELAVAEARLAATSVALMAFLGMVAALFAVGAWGMVVAGIIAGMVKLGLSLWISLAIIGAVHLLATVLIWRAAMRLGDHVTFAATRRQLSKPGDETYAPDATNTAG